MEIYKNVQEAAAKSGMWQSGFVETADLKFYPELREYCRNNICRNYGASWACPPAVGTVEECRERVLRYKKLLLFSAKYDLKEPFDIDGMRKAMYAFKRNVDLLDENLKGILEDYLLLSNEGCGRCSRCTYPDSPCRFPESLHHSIEGYGLHVSQLAEAAGIHYRGGENTVIFFGGLLFEKAGATKIQKKN